MCQKVHHNADMGKYQFLDMHFGLVIEILYGYTDFAGLIMSFSEVR